MKVEKMALIVNIGDKKRGAKKPPSRCVSLYYRFKFRSSWRSSSDVVMILPEAL